MKTINASNKKTAIIAASLCAIMGIAGTMAYFTDKDSAENQIQIGEVSVDLTEPLWDAATDTDKDGIPDYAENVVPTQSIQKDPMVTNTGDSSAYVFIKVSTPKTMLYFASDDGTLPNGRNEMLYEVFTYAADTTNWVLVSTNKSDANVNSYTYGYKKALAPGESTTKLFSSVNFRNAVEGLGLENTIQNINIEAYGIQSQGIVDVQNAYTFYMNQNS